MADIPDILFHFHQKLICCFRQFQNMEYPVPAGSVFHNLLILLQLGFPFFMQYLKKFLSLFPVLHIIRMERRKQIHIILLRMSQNYSGFSLKKSFQHISEFLILQYFCISHPKSPDNLSCIFFGINHLPFNLTMHSFISNSTCSYSM